MADRGAWLRALGLVANGEQQTGIGPCPDCGQHQLELRYIADATSRIGYALFWCGACLHGITISRVRAPEGIRIWPIDDPRSTANVPDFIRHD
ncbi:hypothetical protein ACLF6K_24955 [Streptomyces xanthophaeus]|uniref:hypothetical protein n=1 Tax=Streptomyces xanthophaeus TaxID=67385 RepID=UPI0039901485